MSDLKITALGGGGEIGASCYLLQVAGRNILLDAGVKVGESSFSYPGFHLLPRLGLKNGLADVDAVLVSHAHLDHMGALPLVVRESPGVQVVATNATRELLWPMLGQLAGRPSMEGLFFDRPDIARVAGSVMTVEELHMCGAPCALLYDGSIMVSAYPAGHLAGAACFHIQTPGGSVLYTGDFCLRHQWTARGMCLPQGLEADLLLMESTYANQGPDPGGPAQNCGSGFYRQAWPVVRDTLEAGGQVLLPAFALGRAQEVVCGLNYAMALDRCHYPIYIDGLALEISRLYEGPAFSLYRPQGAGELSRGLLFGGLGVVPVQPGQDGPGMLISGGPACVVASSGQLLSDTASARYAGHIFQSKKNTLALTGFQARGTPGEALQKGAAAVMLGQSLHRVRCRVEFLPMSGHAQLPEMLQLVRQVSPRRVALVHGEPPPGGSLLERSLQSSGVQVQRLMDGDTLAMGPGAKSLKIV